jgi:hypothetical protein
LPQRLTARFPKNTAERRPVQIQLAAQRLSSTSIIGRDPVAGPFASMRPGKVRVYSVRPIAIFPHTHLRGKSWQYTLVYPDGHSQVVLPVPTYDFNWQTYYIFANPVAAPKGS